MSWRTIHLHYVRNQRHNVEKFLWRTVKLERRHSTESVHSPTWIECEKPRLQWNSFMVLQTLWLCLFHCVYMRWVNFDLLPLVQFTCNGRISWTWFTPSASFLLQKTDFSQQGFFPASSSYRRLNMTSVPVRLHRGGEYHRARRELY